MKFLIFILSLVTIPSFSASSSKTIDCTSKDSMRRFKKQCRSVIDPMKFKQGFLVTINCHEALQDGYEMGICENVSFKDQSKMKANSAKLKTEQ